MGLRKYKGTVLILPFIIVILTFLLSCNNSEKGKEKQSDTIKKEIPLDEQVKELSHWIATELCGGQEWHSPENLKETHNLSLYKCNVKNEDVKRLSQYSFLTERVDSIAIGGENLTNECLNDLQLFKKLEYLAFPRSQITLKGLSQYKAFYQLKGLQLDLLPYTNEDFKDISNFVELELLTIIGTSIDDEGLKHLIPLSNLKKFFLINSKITDKGVRYLKQLKRLKLLNIERTSITDKGLKELKKSLPDCEIISLGKKK